MQPIVGAGLAGLLAANMLRHRDPVIYEALPSLPHNHSAVLRFRSGLVGEVLGIPFRRVQVVKTVLPWRNPAADALAYSRKCLGVYRSDRSILRGNELVERWIAPPDLVERMARGVRIKYGWRYDFQSRFAVEAKPISTIPMPHLMMELGYESHARFGKMPGQNFGGTIEGCDAYVSVQVPDPAVPISRISITGDQLVVEVPGPEDREGFPVWDAAAELLGMSPVRIIERWARSQDYAKILPVDDAARKNFIFWASSATGRAFSLGRYATWRPGLLLDDLVQDVRLIDGWIESGTPGYDMDLHGGRGR